MVILLQIAGLALVGLVLWLLFRCTTSADGSDTRCATCNHCKKLFSDGSLCVWGSTETFKNEVHIRNCTDYQRRA